MRKYICLIILTCLITTSCENDDDKKFADITALEAKVINGEMVITLKDNETLQLNVFISPQKASNQELTYENKYPSILQIDSKGFITAKSVGVDTITITTKGDYNTRISYKVNVITHLVKATSIEIPANVQQMELEWGKTFDLASKVTVKPDDVSNKALTYKSSNQSVATVDANGLVTAVAEGNVVITVTAADGSGVFAESSITVLSKVYVATDLTRTIWNVTTSHNYVTDAAALGTPESLIDADNSATCLSLYKPGQGGVPATDVVFFVIDMGSQQEFNYLRLRHRTTNTSVNLRVQEISLYGSNDGSTFVEIKKAIPIDNTVPEVSADITADMSQKVKYRYVKMTYDKWAGSGMTMQIADFKLGLYN